MITGTVITDELKFHTPHTTPSILSPNQNSMHQRDFKRINFCAERETPLTVLCHGLNKIQNPLQSPDVTFSSLER